MLGKLLKYDIKDILKSMLPVYLILVITAGLIRGFALLSEEIGAFRYALCLAFIVFVFAIIFALIFAFILSIKEFYKKVLKDEGYLTNTLPVKKSSILLSKLLTSVLVMLITAIIIILSCLIAYDLIEGFQNTWNLLEGKLLEIGYNIYVCVAIFVGLLILGYMGTVSMIYCALAIGHGFSNNKLAYSAVAGIIIYFIYQFINIFGIIALILINPEMITNLEQPVIPENIVQQLLGINYITASVIVVSTFLVTNYQLSKRLNLD